MANNPYDALFADDPVAAAPPRAGSNPYDRLFADSAQPSEPTPEPGLWDRYVKPAIKTTGEVTGLPFKTLGALGTLAQEKLYGIPDEKSRVQRDESLAGYETPSIEQLALEELVKRPAAGIGGALSAAEGGDYKEAARRAAGAFLPLGARAALSMAEKATGTPTAAEPPADPTQPAAIPGMAPRYQDTVARPLQQAEAVAEPLGELAVGLPLYGESFGALGKISPVLERAAGLAMAPGMIEGGIEGFQRAKDIAQERGVTDPEALRAGFGGVSSLGLGALGLYHGLRGGRAARPEEKPPVEAAVEPPPAEAPAVTEPEPPPFGITDAALEEALAKPQGEPRLVVPEAQRRDAAEANRIAPRLEQISDGELAARERFYRSEGLWQAGDLVREEMARRTAPEPTPEPVAEPAPRYAYRARDVGEEGIPSTGHAQASMSEADVRRLAPSRSESPQEIVRVDVSKLAPEDYELSQGPNGQQWATFKRPVPEAAVERVGEVTDIDRKAADKAALLPQPEADAIASEVDRALADPAEAENLAAMAGLTAEQAKAGASDVKADGRRELSPEAVAIKRAILEHSEAFRHENEQQARDAEASTRERLRQAQVTLDEQQAGAERVGSAGNAQGLPIGGDIGGLRAGEAGRARPEGPGGPLAGQGPRGELQPGAAGVSGQGLPDQARDLPRQQLDQEEPVRPGFRRLYRGVTAGDRSPGRWWSTQRSLAEEYAGPKGEIVSVDLPSREVERYRAVPSNPNFSRGDTINDTHFILPKEVAARGKVRTPTVFQPEARTEPVPSGRGRVAESVRPDLISRQADLLQGSGNQDFPWLRKDIARELFDKAGERSGETATTESERDLAQRTRKNDWPTDGRGQPIYPGEEHLTPAQREILSRTVEARIAELRQAQVGAPTGRRPILDENGRPVYKERYGSDMEYSGTPSHKVGTALESIPEGPKQIDSAIERDKGNALERRIRQAVLENDSELRDYFEQAGEARFATRPAPGQRGLEGIAEDVPAAAERKRQPEQRRMFGGEMLHGVEAKVPEGREAEGPLFTQEREAQARAEGKEQGGLFAGSERQAQRGLLTLANVRESGPGLNFSERDGYFVAPLRDGGEVRINPVGEIEIGPGERAAFERSAEAGGGGERVAVGSYRRFGKDAIVSVVGRGPLNHELYHFFEDFALSGREVAAAAKRFGDAEARAYAYEKWLPTRQTPNSWFSKIYAHAKRLIGYLHPLWDTGFEEVASGRAAQRVSGESETATTFATAPKPEGADSARQEFIHNDLLGKHDPEVDRNYIAGTLKDLARSGNNQIKARAIAAAERVGKTKLDPGADEYTARTALFGALPDISRKQASQLAQVLKERPQDLQEAIKAAVTPRGLDKWLEAWKAGLVSAPGTQVANVSGNLAEQLVRIVETATAAGTDKLLGGPRTRLSGEASFELRGAADGAVRSLGQLGRDLKDIFTLAPEKLDLSFPLERQGGAIPGKTGLVVRVPLRLLSSFDNFFKGLGGRAELYKQAWRRAGGNEAAARDIISNPPQDIIEQVAKSRQERTFQEPNELAEKIVQLRSKNKLFQIILPFVNTPANIATATWRRSPAGFVEAGKALAEYRRAKNYGASAETVARLKGQAVDALSKPLVGLGILATFGAIAKAGGMTGSGPTDPKDRNALRETGWQQYSFVIPTPNGKVYVPFNRFEPISSLLGFAADMVEARDEKTAGDIASKAIGSITQNLTSKTYLQGIADAAGLITDPMKAGGQYVKGLAGSVVPNIVAKAAQAIDPIQRETKSTEPGLGGYAASLGKTVAARVPFLSEALPAQRSGTGAEVERPGNAVSRFLLPVQPTGERAGSDLPRFLVSLGAVHAPPGNTLTIPGSHGKTVSLSADERAVLSDADQKASDYLRRVIRDPRFQRMDPEEQKATVEQIYSRYRTAGRQRLYMMPSFRAKAMATGYRSSSGY